MMQYFSIVIVQSTVQPERNAQTKFSYNQFANLVAFGLHVNLARSWPNWLKTKFSPGVSFWLYCIQLVTVIRCIIDEYIQGRRQGVWL